MAIKHTANSYVCEICGTVYRDSRQGTGFQRATECEAADRKQAEDRRLSVTKYVRSSVTRGERETRATLGEIKYLGETVILRDVQEALLADEESATEVVRYDPITGTLLVRLDGRNFRVRIESESTSEK